MLLPVQHPVPGVVAKPPVAANRSRRLPLVPILWLARDQEAVPRQPQQLLLTAQVFRLVPPSLAMSSTAQAEPSLTTLYGMPKPIKPTAL